ncbi:MAG TPA: phosphoenolpyruvate carboxykinase (GTP) [Verrucomicrobiae bacterium]
MATPPLGERITQNPHLIRFVEESAALCKPDRVFWCNGSAAERKALTAEAVATGVLIELNQSKLPGCYYHRSAPNDVARVEKLTFICTDSEEEAGPLNNWAPPAEMKKRLHGLLDSSMRGRTLYVIPYLMGPPGSPLSKVGVELTDSIYVVLSMGIMTRMGHVALEHLAQSNPDDFNRGLHSMLDVHPDRRYIAHFPQENSIISVGSNYGGNVLLGKKCLALRIGSHLARRENWLAEHMLILGVESPEGEKNYVAAAFPSACGKTNFAMMVPPPLFSGWKVRTIGDDIAWMKPGPDGRLYAINPEAGYFGVVPGTNSKSNPNAVAMIQRDTIYTNVALTPDLDVWWEGKDGPIPAECLDWQGNRWTPESKTPAAHPNSRFTCPAENNPMFAPEANDPAGVPISAIIFGGRRSDTLPLVFQSFDWGHGIYLGAMMGSETTAAAVGASGQLRRDPFAMLPFCGYDMGRYFGHWLHMRKHIHLLPRIFHVNWFRKDATGKYLWPGFGENMRVLKWIIDRCHGRVRAKETVLGWMPFAEQFDCEGLSNFHRPQFDALQSIVPSEWKKEITLQDELFINLYHTIPKELTFQRELLMSRI